MTPKGIEAIHIDNRTAQTTIVRAVGGIGFIELTVPNEDQSHVKTNIGVGGELVLNPETGMHERARVDPSAGFLQIRFGDRERKVEKYCAARIGGVDFGVDWGHHSVSSVSGQPESTNGVSAHINNWEGKMVTKGSEDSRDSESDVPEFGGRLVFPNADGSEVTLSVNPIGTEIAVTRKSPNGFMNGETFVQGSDPIADQIKFTEYEIVADGRSVSQVVRVNVREACAEVVNPDHEFKVQVARAGQPNKVELKFNSLSWLRSSLVKEEFVSQDSPDDPEAWQTDYVLGKRYEAHQLRFQPHKVRVCGLLSSEGFTNLVSHRPLDPEELSTDLQPIVNLPENCRFFTFYYDLLAQRNKQGGLTLRGRVDDFSITRLDRTKLPGGFPSQISDQEEEGIAYQQVQVIGLYVDVPKRLSGAVLVRSATQSFFRDDYDKPFIPSSVPLKRTNGAQIRHFSSQPGKENFQLGYDAPEDKLVMEIKSPSRKLMVTFANRNSGIEATFSHVGYDNRYDIEKADGRVVEFNPDRSEIHYERSLLDLEDAIIQISEATVNVSKVHLRVTR